MLKKRHRKIFITEIPSFITEIPSFITEIPSFITEKTLK